MKLKEPIAKLHPSELRIAGRRTQKKRTTKKCGKKKTAASKKPVYKMTLF